MASNRPKRWTPRLILSLIEGLPDTGNYHAARSGGLDHRGWGIDRHIAVNAYDLALTVAMAPKKPKRDQLHPRPGKKARGRKLTDLMPRTPPAPTT